MKFYKHGRNSSEAGVFPLFMLMIPLFYRVVKYEPKYAYKRYAYKKTCSLLGSYLPILHIYS